MEQTPIKADISTSSPLQDYLLTSTTTPESTSSSKATFGDAENELIGCLTSMKLDNGLKASSPDFDIPYFKLKRPLEHQTIEGSPFTTGIPKKLDGNPTPARFIFEEKSNQPLVVKSTASVRPTAVVQIKQPQETNKNSAVFPLLVLTSNSDDHDTGVHHQENALRTTLLCGEKGIGCLRRPMLDGNIEWVDCDHLQLPSIVDLLR
jgi:hypothetical protein